MMPREHYRVSSKTPDEHFIVAGLERVTSAEHVTVQIFKVMTPAIQQDKDILS